MSILQARRYQKRDADLDAVAASGVAMAWTAWTPTITAASGTFTTVSATGTYVKVGRIVSYRMVITITTNGTAATGINSTLPVTSAANQAAGGGEEVNVTAKGVVAIISGSSLVIRNQDATYPGGSGYAIWVAGSYEASS